MPERRGSTVIENVQPQLDCGRYPVKRVAGGPVRVTADIFKEGHDDLSAVVRWRRLNPDPTEPREQPMRFLGNDVWEAELPLASSGLYAFTVEAWPDSFRTWVHELQRKLEVGRDVSSELLEGAALLDGAAARAEAAGARADAESLRKGQRALLSGPAPATLLAAVDPGLVAAASRHADRAVASRMDRELRVFAERERAVFSAWYEFFPRSASGDPKRHGTFRDAEKWLPYIAGLGFDVVYLPPIHPIGKTARKGKNNSLAAAADDVGSPWAIGSPEGGHKAIHPQLGTLDDFRHFVASAKDFGMEVALDIAFQCSPDHPYVKEHPEWFQRRPDGTIKTAENPPKRYEDIVNFDWMGPAREALWAELRSVFLHWMAQGVKIFRVDNPHTKPLPFWEWVIAEVHARDPEVIFLAEAFTRPKVMKALARSGFNQSYTYFTWRNFKQEIEEYLTELTQGPPADFMIGNLWPNTPDILPEHLQQGGRPAFLIRAALAATLSSSWGIYSGFELCENRALPGREEYLDSEKYQLIARDLEREGGIKEWIAALNAARREHRALQAYRNLRFHRADSDRVLFYSKATEDRSSLVLAAVSLDPYASQEAILHVPLDRLGIPEDETYQVHDVLSGERALWQGSTALVRLTPEKPASLWSVLRFRRSEQGFDYYF
ncbi:MAG TPA: alpha-1,4-glucan--maltose-1-phosphate maltosyltransferase [Myxococcales bacterium]|nr:alpha-1,4-glucan--maltose-1-phosphate maltosyltransferase [Myxococcales bacterium]